MKRFLSAILTLALVLSLIPAVFAADAQTYTFQKTSSNTSFFKSTVEAGYLEYRTIKGTTYYINEDYSDYTTNRNWKIVDISNDYFEKAVAGANFAQLKAANAISANYGGKFSLALKATQTGFYIPQITLYSAKNDEETLKLRWYIYKAGTSQSYNDYIGNGETVYDNRVLRVSNVTNEKAEELFTAEKVVYTQVDQELISSFASDSNSAYRNYGITLTPVQNAKINVQLKDTDSRSIELDVTADGRHAFLTDPTVTGDNLETEMAIAGGFVEYKSSNEKVATVANEGTNKGRIWARSAGEAEIWVQSPDGAVKSEPIKVTVTPSTVSFAQTTNVPEYDGISVSSVARGSSVELTAHKGIDGYKFIGWKRGANASDENAWVDIHGDSYTVWTNTYLTAIYEKETDITEKAVEFWNQNGAYIGKMDEATYVAQTELFTPKLTGFGAFLGWLTDGNVPFTAGMTLADGVTNAVAQYNASAISNVTFNGNAIAGADTYNVPVQLNKDNEATAWLRDGEPIAYGDTYKFNVWDATNITEGTEEITDKVPVAILDYSANHKAYMLEYDAGDYEIVEAGIIFGKDTADIKTYTSQRKENHNQFTVPEEGALEATGYIIYTLNNGVSYKTKYVSVKE